MNYMQGNMGYMQGYIQGNKAEDQSFLPLKVTLTINAIV